MIELESRINDSGLIIVHKPEGIASPERVRYQESRGRQQNPARKKKSESKEDEGGSRDKQLGTRLDVEA